MVELSKGRIPLSSYFPFTVYVLAVRTPSREPDETDLLETTCYSAFSQAEAAGREQARGDRRAVVAEVVVESTNRPPVVRREWSCAEQGCTPLSGSH